MTEFVLSDDKQELAHATKTPIPEYILQGISEQEYLIQKERELEQELETLISATLLSSHDTTVFLRFS